MKASSPSGRDSGSTPVFPGLQSAGGSGARAALLAAALLYAGASGGCGWRGTGTPVQDRENHVITAEQIERSGARNAWEALQRSGSPLSLGQNRRGEPERVRQRGNSSMLLDNTPLLIVDEARINDIAYLLQIRAEAISRIVVMSGTRGTARYGTNAANGVIVVTTR